MASTVPHYQGIIRLAIPIILANSATPLLGLVDTAVIGHVAGAADLGGIALGALIFSFVYWGFGFLRMSTSGFVAQAQGRNQLQQIQFTLLRALLLAAAIGVLLILLQWPLRTLALSIFGASDAVESVTQDYFSIRIWSAPACLANYVLSGVLIGLGRGRSLLFMQLTLNGLNILFDVLFAGVLGWGANGIALGTVLAEWMTFAVFGLRVLNAIELPLAQLRNMQWQHVMQKESFSAMLKANGDIMIRTVVLLAGFGIFNDQGARFGDITLAANHLLLQFISFSAFFLDGFAFVSESLAGRAFGARHRAQFDLAVRRTSVLAGVTALLLAALLLATGEQMIGSLTAIASVNQMAITYLPLAALYVMVSFAAFQLDGIFIGCTATRDMRNSALLATLLFAALCFPSTHWFGNLGLWCSFIGFVVVRALTLGAKLPGLRQQCNQPAPEQ